MKKEDLFEEENENNLKKYKNLELKVENNIYYNIDSNIDIDSDKNIDNDNDKETDDILTKLGNLSLTSDDKSFYSPIIFNRTKSFVKGDNNDSPKLLYDEEDNSNILNDNYVSRTKTVKREKRPKTIFTKKKNKKLNKVRAKSTLKIRKKSNIQKELQSINLNEDITTLFRNNTIYTLKSGNNIYNNTNSNKRLTDMGDNLIKNKSYNKKFDRINIKISDIALLIKEMKFIDKKYNKIINNYLFKNKETNLDNIFESISELLDYIIEILNSIQYYIKNENKKANEKILKFQKEIKEKDKQVIELINKINLEKMKFEKTSNSNNIETINLRKQNKDLNYKIFYLQKHISKLELNNETLEEKLNQFILDKIKTKINSSNSIKCTCITNNFSNIEHPSFDQNYLLQKRSSFNDNNHKLNDKFNIYRKINFNLIDLLKKINNTLCYYDSLINKECGIIKNMQNVVKNLTKFIDINELIEEKKMAMMANEFMRNMDIIFTKIEKFIKEINKNNSLDIKYIPLNKYLSTTAIMKNDKSKDKSINKSKDKSKDKSNNKNKDNKSNNIKVKINIFNMSKKINSAKYIYTNNNYPKRKRTKTINNVKH